MEQTKQYYNVNKKYLALALSFLGFHYRLFTTDLQIEYAFENTEQFKNALNDLLKLKKKYNNYYIHND
jgi:hypothetical protein